MRRFGRIDRLARAVRAHLNGGFWFEADRYTAPSGGKIPSFIDYLDSTHTLANGNAAQQVATPTPEPLFHDALVARFTGAQMYQGSRAASAYNFLHNGSDATFIAGFIVRNATSTRVYFGTNSSGAAARGMGFYQSTNTAVTVSNGSALIVVTNILTPTTANTARAYRFVMGTAQTPDYALYVDGVLSQSGSYGAAPSASDASHALIIGSNAGLAFPSIIDWAFVMATPIALGASALADIQAYVRMKYGPLNV